MSVSYSVYVDYVVRGDGGLAKQAAAYRAQNALYTSMLRNQQAAQMGSHRKIASHFNRTMGGAISGAGNFLSSASSSILSTAATLGAAIGGVIGAGMTYAVAKFNSEIEQTKIGLAGIFQASGVGDFKDSLKIADVLNQRMIKDAAALPGTYKQLVDTFQAVATPGLQSGMSVGQLEKFAANTLAIGVVNQLPARVAAREMRAMLQGQVHSQNILAQMLVPQMGMDIKTFNHLDPAKRVAAINAVFGKYKDSFAAFENSFVGLSTTTLSYLQILLGKIGAPLFERVKDSLRSVNDYFTGHKTQIEDFANHWGVKIANGFSAAMHAGKMLLPVVGALVNHIDHLTTKEGIRGVGTALAVTAGLGVGGKVLSGAGGLMSSLGPMAMGGASGGGSAMMAMISNPVGWGALLAAIVGVTVGTVQLAGAYRILTDSTNKYYTAGMGYLHSMGVSFESAMSSLGDAWAKVQAPILQIVDLAGVQMLDALGKMARAMSIAVGTISSVAGKISDNYQAVRRLLGLTGTTSEAHERGKEFPHKEWVDESALGRKGTVLPQVVNHNTTIHQTNNFSVVSADDPSRVARAVMRTLEDLSRNPREAKTGVNFSRI